MKYLLILITVLFSGWLNAQSEDVVYEYQKGKKYIVHFVQDGNTLWGLQETYKVPAKEIIAANPGAEKKITEGQKLLIPAGVAEAKYADGTMIKEHTIAKGETLFGLAKKEGASVEEITKMNPGVETGLKLGQVVKIPVKSITEQKKEYPVNQVKEVETTVDFKDTVITHTVLDHETLYSISKRFMVPVEELQKFNKLKNTSIKPGQVLQIPLKKEQVKQIEIRQVETIKEEQPVDKELLFPDKEVYNIAVMLPFYLDGGEPVYKNIATEFYMGVELAVDSLERMGLKAKLFVYDAKNDSAALVALLKKPEMKQMDLVFGPLIPQNADIVAKWCKEHNIRMVCPTAVSSSVLKGNPLVYAAVPTDITLERILARYTLDNHSKDQIVLVNTGVARDKELYDAYRDRFIELSKTKGNIKLIEIKSDDLAAYIRKNGNTVFVVPTRDRSAAMKFMGNLQKSGSKAGSGTISVFGTKEWAMFDDIRGVTRNKFNLHWASASDLNYTLPETKSVLRQFRRKFKSDMSKYSAQGYDVTLHFCRTLLLDKEAVQGVMNVFGLEKVGEGNGFENSQAFIVKNVEFELERVAVVNE